jgi:maleylpyruvate isomerase
MHNDVSESLDRLEMATRRLLVTSATLTDAEVREPSLLPGWTRGHVLSHLARNADGLGNLLRGAAIGTQIPMYASSQARDAGIEAGAGRPAAELAADVRDSAAAFAERAASLSAEAWAFAVRARTGGTFPAHGVLDRRLSEVEIHHVDLGAGYGPGDWPKEFVADHLPAVARSFAGREDTPGCRVQPDGGEDGFWIGPADAGQSPVAVAGPACDLLAWLLGRDAGTGLRVVPGATLPVLPAWR